MEIALILRTGRADFPYNVQVWTENTEDGLKVRKYAGRGKFCADLEAAYNYAAAEGLKATLL